MSDWRIFRAAAGTAAVAAMLAAGAAQGQHLQSTTSARQLNGERHVDVAIEYGAGRLRVAPTRGDLLYRMDLRYDADRYRPVADYDRGAGRLKLGVESRDRHGGGNEEKDQSATIELTPQVPTALSLEFGAGEADVDLGGLALDDVQVQTGASRTTVSFTSPNRVAARRVKLEAGAADLRVNGLGNTRAQRFEFSGGVGQTTLDFGGSWTQSARARVEMGVGSLRLRLPRTLGVRIEKDSFLASFSPSDMVRRGNAWYSRGYDQARYRLDLSISAAMGSIDVDWID